MARKATMKAAKTRRPRKAKTMKVYLQGDPNDVYRPLCNTCNRHHYGPCMDKNFETRTSFAIGPLGIGIQIHGHEMARPVYVEAFLSWNDAAQFRDTISEGLARIVRGKHPAETDPKAAANQAEPRYLGLAKIKQEGQPDYDPED